MKALSVYIGWRYTRAKRRNHFISFMALAAMLGIALGVMVLITVLSVMNGFDKEIKAQIFGMAQHVSIANFDGKIEDWQAISRTLSKHPQVLATAPFVSGQSLLRYGSSVKAAFLLGVLPQQERDVSALAQHMVVGKLTDLQPGKFGLILGEQLANQLNVRPGDKLTVMIPELTVSPFGTQPRFKQFTVQGMFSVGGGFRFDTSLAFIHMQDAQKLWGLRDSATGIRLKIRDVLRAPEIAYQIAGELTQQFYVTNWTQQFGAFFKAIKLEKNMMFLILLLIIAVAAFNLISGLVMVVTDKQADIAILRTLGATPALILRIFIVQGCIIGFIGTVLGVISGIVLADNVTTVVNWLQRLLHVQLISANVYFVDYLPSDLQWRDVFKITLAAFVMSLLATLYPAWRAARIQPAEALRYE